MSQFPLKCEEVRQCALESWLPSFSSVTFKTVSIALSPEFVTYLVDDTNPLLLPKDVDCLVDTLATIEDDVCSLDNENDSEDETLETPHFSTELKNIQDAIKELGNDGIFCKLNWSAPQDAVWITMDRTLKCRSPTEIILLLKSSDAIAYDLNCPYDLCNDVTPGKETQYYLHLRQWQELHYSMEFRCFIRDNEIVAISQRHVHIYYPFLGEMKSAVLDHLVDFHERYVRDSFSLSHYVMDVYLVPESKQVILVDFNAFHPITDSKLFDWHELQTVSCEGNRPLFRWVQSSEEILPTPNYVQSYPEDLLNLHHRIQQASLEEILDDVLAENDQEFRKN